MLVALDGFELAEGVLPGVLPLAERLGSVLLLLRATPRPVGLLVPPARGAGLPTMGSPAVDPALVQRLADEQRRETAAYLAAVVRRLRETGVAVEVAQPEGSAPDAIVDYTGNASVTLIAMTTHGGGGLSRLVFGSLPDAVLRRAPCPVLLVRVGGGGA